MLPRVYTVLTKRLQPDQCASEVLHFGVFKAEAHIPMPL
jgi:hypothetical protein